MHTKSINNPVKPHQTSFIIPKNSVQPNSLNQAT